MRGAVVAWEEPFDDGVAVVVESGRRRRRAVRGADCVEPVRRHTSRYRPDEVSQRLAVGPGRRVTGLPAAAGTVDGDAVLGHRAAPPVPAWRLCAAAASSTAAVVSSIDAARGPGARAA